MKNHEIYLEGRGLPVPGVQYYCAPRLGNNNNTYTPVVIVALFPTRRVVTLHRNTLFYTRDLLVVSTFRNIMGAHACVSFSSTARRSKNK